MTAAYCYNPNRFRKAQGDDWQSWLSLFDVISSNVTFIDRTANIINPIRSTIPNFLAMPAYDPGFAMTYEECCQSAAQRLLALQESLDVPIRILYSGGIDSSLVLTSFINQLGQQAAERRIQGHRRRRDDVNSGADAQFRFPVAKGAGSNLCALGVKADRYL